MEDVDLRQAKEHLEELFERARRGEDVAITDPKLGRVWLTRIKPLDLTAPRISGQMEPFVPLKQPRRLGELEGKVPPPPNDFFDPMSEEELKDWYGED
jgi:antitoxin (DNA-binding transcriptional repressor) of toxin-antitoxin stability system